MEKLFLVELKNDGFFNTEIDIQFQGTINDCKKFLKDKEKELINAGITCKFTTDEELTLEILYESHSQASGEKYMIHPIF